jgi:hypothetical protein
VRSGPFRRYSRVMGIPRHTDFYRISLCTCENVAENSALGSCFRQPFHPEEPPPQTVAHVFTLTPPPSSSSEAYFGSTSSVPRMDSSRSTQPGHGSRYIWDRVPNQSSRLPPSFSFLSVLPQCPRRPPSSLLLSKLKLLPSFELDPEYHP